MISFAIENLKDFQKRTQYIKPNSALPSLAYIKLECKGGKHYLTKNNLRCVCVSLINGIGECPDLLLDDRIFFGFIGKAKSERIDITWDERSIYLSDGKKKIDFSRENPIDFPKTPDYSSVKTSFVLTREHLDAISVASNFVLDSETGGNFRFVHIGGEFISAFHTHYFYVNNKFTELPNLVIDAEISNVITAGLQYEVAISENHYFFQAGNVMYIFTQQEGKTPNIKTQVLSRLQLPGKDFQFAKENIIDFCDLSNIICESQLVNCSMNIENEKLLFTMKDNNMNRGNVHPAAVVGTMDKFNFDSKMSVAPLRAIPYETLKSKTVQNCFIISDPSGKEFFCFMGLNI